MKLFLTISSPYRTIFLGLSVALLSNQVLTSSRGPVRWVQKPALSDR